MAITQVHEYLMRNVTFDRFGDPMEVLQISEVPIPNPELGQIRIKLIKRPIHPVDLMMVRGLYGVKPPLPSTPGAEALAIIDALGAGVTEFESGQRVVSLGTQGTWSDYLIVQPTSLIPIPDSVPDGVACQMFLNPLTANLLLDSVAAKKGDWLIQSAANSTVGRIIVQLAKRRGINLINLVRRNNAIDELKRFGAEHVLSTEDSAWPKHVPELTGKVPVTKAIDAVGGSLSLDMISVLVQDSIFLAYGALAGQSLLIDPNSLIFSNVIVRGFWLANWFQTADPAQMQKVISELVQLVATGELILPIEAEYDLADFKQALQHAERPGRSGKILMSSQI
jgi:NADPH:quinone reductase